MHAPSKHMVNRDLAVKLFRIYVVRVGITLRFI